MRLIDADVLKKEIHMSYSDDLCILPKIDEQPTITRECSVCGRHQTTFCEKCVNRKDDKK